MCRARLFFFCVSFFVFLLSGAGSWDILIKQSWNKTGRPAETHLTGPQRQIGGNEAAEQHGKHISAPIPISRRDEL